MAWKPGQSGNPHGRTTEKDVANCIRAAMNAEDPRTKRRKLQVMAEAVADLAMKCEPWAVNFVADRLDGKPAQESTVTIDNKRDGTDWARHELVAFLHDAKAGSNGAAKANGRVGEPDSVH